MVCPILVFLHSTLPELSDTLDYGSPFFLQPLHVFCDTVIFPGSHRNSPWDVVLKWSWSRPYWTLLITRFRTLPREHCAFITIEVSIIFGSFQPIKPILYQGFGQSGVKDQNSRIHPQIHVPKHVSVVPKSTESHRTQSIAFELVNKTVKMINHRPYSPLIFRVAFNYNIIFPQVAPQLLMSGNH